MKKYLLAAVLFLSGCSVFQSAPTQLDVSQKIKHGNKNYQLGKQRDLGEVARYVYWLPKQNAQSWQSAVELFLDRNKRKLSLDERIALRRKVYNGQPNAIKDYNLYTENNYLYGYIIYEPTTLNKSWQVDVLKGKDINHCGFVQYQYSVKVARTAKIRKMTKDKLAGYLKKYVADKELAKLKKQSWKWQCTAAAKTVKAVN